MAVVEVGRVCMKIAGREAGKFCVVVETPKDGFVTVTGPKTITRVKRRKCNVVHIEPTGEIFNISESADDSAVEKAWNESGLIEKLKIEVPTKFRQKEPKE